MKWSIKSFFGKSEKEAGAVVSQPGSLANDVTAFLYKEFGFGVWWLAEIGSDEEFAGTSFEKIPLCFAFDTGELCEDGSSNWRVGINSRLIENAALVVAQRTGFVGDIEPEVSLVGRSLYEIVTKTLFDAVEDSGLSVRECCDLMTAKDLANRGR